MKSQGSWVSCVQEECFHSIIDQGSTHDYIHCYTIKALNKYIIWVKNDIESIVGNNNYMNDNNVMAMTDKIKLDCGSIKVDISIPVITTKLKEIKMKSAMAAHSTYSIICQSPFLLSRMMTC